MKIMQKFFMLSLIFLLIGSISYAMEKPEHKLALELQSKGKGKTRKINESSSAPQVNQEQPVSTDTSDIAKLNRLLAKVFAQAPIDVKNIVNHLKDPDFFEEPSYRFAFFIGAPGVGKSTQADAVAAELLQYGWSHQKYASTDFQDKNRGGTAEKLNKVLNSIDPKQKTLLLIEEINHLFEHADDRHHDTDATSKSLWSFLDAQRFNHNFFLVGTMNKIEDAPQQIKSRALGKNIWISEAVGDAVKIDILRTCFAGKKFTMLHTSCDDAFFKEFVQRIINWNIRDLTSLVFKAEAIFRRKDQTSKKRVIRKEHLEEALRELVDEKKRVKWGKQKESTAERQDRLFIQQQFIQLILDMKAGKFNSTTVREITRFMSDTIPFMGESPEDKLKVMTHIFTDEQWEMMRKLVENGDKRRAQIDARKNRCAIQ